jgi:hypothetical protein
MLDLMVMVALQIHSPMFQDQMLEQTLAVAVVAGLTTT